MGEQENRKKQKRNKISHFCCFLSSSPSPVPNPVEIHSALLRGVVRSQRTSFHGSGSG